MPSSFRCLPGLLPSLLTGALLLAGCAQVQLDPFGRPYSGEGTLRPGAPLCTVPDVDVQPRIVRGNLPIAPADNYFTARNAEATVRVRVNEQGAVQVLDVKDVSDKVFGNYARIAAADWKTTPARRGGLPVAVECLVRVGTVFRGFEDEPAGKSNQ